MDGKKIKSAGVILLYILKGEEIKIEKKIEWLPQTIYFTSHAPQRILSHLIYTHWGEFKVDKMKELNRRAKTWCNIYLIYEVWFRLGACKWVSLHDL